MPKFAANLSMMFHEVAFLDRFDAAAQAGFKGVEFLFPYQYDAPVLADKLQTSQLRNVLFNLPPGDWAAGERGLASLPGREAEFRAGVVQALQYATALGTPALHAMTGVLPQGADYARHHATLIANLRYAAALCADQGVTILIEPINTRDMPGYFLTRQAQAHAIREEVAAANVQVQMDLYHVQIMEGDIATKIRTYLPHIGHIQIAGVPGRQEPDNGEVHYPYLLRLLDELGYAGWVGCEYRPAADTRAGLAWLSQY